MNPDMPSLPDAPVELRPILGTDLQLGFVVKDLDRAMRHWIEVIGVGPFLHLRNGTGRPPAPSLFRGKPQIIELKLAFAYFGDVQIELIEQVNDAPSIYREFLASGREGLQHLGYAVPDFARADAALRANGYQSELEIPIAGLTERITYFRSPEAMGTMIEIVPPQWRAARATVKAHLANWQGPGPVSCHDSYGSFLDWAARG